MKNTVGIILLILLFLLPPVTDAKTYYKITFKGSKAPKEATFYKEGDRYCTKSYGGENCISENMVGSVEEIEGEWIKPTINDSKHKNTQVTVSKKSNIAKLKSRIYKEKLASKIIKDIIIHPSDPSEAMMIMKPIWHLRSKHLKKNDATQFCQLWASIYSPNKSDMSIVSLLSINGDRVGMASYIFGECFWLDIDK